MLKKVHKKQVYREEKHSYKNVYLLKIGIVLKKLMKN